ncbi:MAG TPA: hypothetical protein VEH09_01550 [Thermodesulfobacteriota bacterium]|nr:hypothetical protein [Thermodesulfobacteriota bacterium]
MENEPDVVIRKQNSGKEITVEADQVIQVQLDGMRGLVIGGMHITAITGIFCFFQKRS